MALLDAQGGVCAICGNDEDGTGQRQLSVDHGHETGAVRGLLCNRCNPMLGYARDSIAVLQAAIEYLGSGNQVLRPPNGVYRWMREAAFHVDFIVTAAPTAPSLEKSGSTVPKK